MKLTLEQLQHLEELANNGAQGKELTEDNLFDCIQKGIDSSQELISLVISDEEYRKKVTNFWFERALIQLNREKIKVDNETILALEILMSKKIFIDRWTELKGDIKKISNSFDVSRDACILRAVQLGLLSFNNK